VVAVRRDARGTTARVVRMPDASFVALTLTMSSDDEPWRDAVGILRGLVRGPPPGPRSQPRTTKGKPAKRKPAKGAPLADPDAPKEDDDDWDLLTSPWFWGGLGVVVTVGVTVLVLSQTTLNEPDVVMLQGRVPR
jgi:hypothetical protein